MDPSVWSRGMYSSSIYLDGCNSEHLSSFQPEPMPSKSNDEAMTMFPERAYYSSTDAGSSMICSNQLVRNASRDNTTRRKPSPASSSCGYHDWGLNSGHQAKRARVENIIRGMTSSPGRHCTDVAANQHEESQGMRENKRIQKLPLHKERSGPDSASHSQRTKKQFDSQPENLRIRFNHMDPITNTTDRIKEEKYTTSHISHGTSERDAWTDSYRGTHQDWKKVELMNYFQSKPERIKLMADVLKYELSRAVSRSVDSIFKSVPLLQNDQENEQTDVPPKSSVCNDLKSKFLCCENAEVKFPGVQTEALSLVVQTQRRYKPPDLFSPDLALCEDQPSKSLNAAKHLALRQLKEKSSGVTQAKFETFDARWNPVKVRTKVNSRSVRSPQTHTVSVDPMIFESLRFPHVKIESDSLVNKDLYRLNEGLTTNHLKKAKLMFFYTRYPSSLVLKMCFHDVQFTRCITSQLIKWFSNFREFFYIQMEKFARHALMEGAADARGLTVGRESELFRTLNMHYNKANDFQVPERFLEVAEITLREFHIAISVGRDRDPSWKKAIYKVICKLDSDVPTEFITHPSG